jgi:hypothetical protein
VVVGAQSGVGTQPPVGSDVEYARTVTPEGDSRVNSKEYGD